MNIDQKRLLKKQITISVKDKTILEKVGSLEKQMTLKGAQSLTQFSICKVHSHLQSYKTTFYQLLLKRKTKKKQLISSKFNTHNKMRI